MAQDEDLPVEFPGEGITLTLPVTQIGENHYRLEAVPAFVEGARYRDVVEAEQVSGGGLRVLGVVERSEWKEYSWIASREIMEDERVQQMLAHVDRLGGYWENSFGGCLFVYLPAGIAFRPWEWYPDL